MARRRRKKLPTEPVAVTIESLSHDGRGVAHIDGKTLFIHGALPDEDVEFIYTKKQRSHDEGKVHKVLKPSPQRVEPKCTHFGLCGGCSLQHQEHQAQVEAKQQALMDAFRRIGKVEPETILPPLTTESTWGYRRKARLGVKYVPKKGKVLVGFREKGSSLVADLEHCEVLHPKVGTLIAPLGKLIDGFSIKDKIPQIEVAMGDEVCVLIFRVLSPLSASDTEALEQFGVEHKLRIYTQDGGPDTVKPLSGETARLSYELPRYGVEVLFEPGDFTQVNSDLNRLMIDRALDLLDPQEEDQVLDLFCGLGNFTLPLAKKTASVVGVEGDAGLVARARSNAEFNGVTNTRYYTANLYDSLEKEPWLKDHFDKVLLDPPRSGAQEVLAPLARMGVKRIVYVSCYPGTLARDAGELVNEHGFKLIAAGVMDMFPHTAHVESIALFER